MATSRNKDYSSPGILWLWLVFLALLLLLIKFFFIGTYYVEDNDAMPNNLSQGNLLIVSIQSKPKYEGDIVLIELFNGELVPAQFISHSEGNYKVLIGDETKWIKPKRIKGKVIKAIRL